MSDVTDAHIAAAQRLMGRYLRFYEEQIIRGVPAIPSPLDDPIFKEPVLQQWSPRKFHCQTCGRVIVVHFKVEGRVSGRYGEISSQLGEQLEAANEKHNLNCHGNSITSLERITRYEHHLPLPPQTRQRWRPPSPTTS